MNFSTKNAVSNPIIGGDITPNGRRTSVTIACCESQASPLKSVRAVANSLGSIARTELLVLSCGDVDFDGVRVVQVPVGTKLTKLRKLASAVESRFICICDPDLHVDPKGAKAIFLEAFKVAECDREVVAFGLVNCQSDNTLLSGVIAIDKWFSHRVLRPILWKCSIGITIPGQFLVLSTSVLQRLHPAVDSYLDDLYLGWIARSTNVAVLRVPVVVGYEESRSSWPSLLLQRLRWMRGFFALAKQLLNEPKAIALLTTHFVAYHGIPILWLACLVGVVTFSWSIGLIVFAAAALAISLLSRQRLGTAIAFLIIFPLLHCLATLLWWIPISQKRLTQR